MRTIFNVMDDEKVHKAVVGIGNRAIWLETKEQEWASRKLGEIIQKAREGQLKRVTLLDLACLRDRIEEKLKERTN